MRIRGNNTIKLMNLCKLLNQHQARSANHDSAFLINLTFNFIEYIIICYVNFCGQSWTSTSEGDEKEKCNNERTENGGER